MENHAVVVVKKSFTKKQIWVIKDRGLKMKRTVGISDYVKRQTEDSQFTHWNGTWDQLGLLATELLADNERFKDTFEKPMSEQGYRDGVMVLHIPKNMCHGFLTYNDFPMFEGMKLEAAYEKVPGREHEPPKVRVKIKEDKKICEYVDLILYGHEVLEEDGDASTDLPWEIVSINGRLNEEIPPMDPMTIVRNWKHLPGGTEMKGATPEEVLEKLCQAVMYKNGIK
jgi:hypothetical protein